VITVAHTFVATAAAIHHTGATPVLVDIADDHNMDIDELEAAFTPRTRAINPGSPQRAALRHAPADGDRPAARA
jgi:dTDP-4-amino-4,6-dideoxygalactose transaminase